jgi:hypothetical protein
VRAADQRIAVRRCIDRIGAVADRLGHKSGLTSHPRKQTSPSPNESPLSASSGNAQSEAPSPPVGSTRTTVPWGIHRDLLRRLACAEPSHAAAGAHA